MTVKNCHLFVSCVFKLSPLQYFSSLRFFFSLAEPIIAKTFPAIHQQSVQEAQCRSALRPRHCRQDHRLPRTWDFSGGRSDGADLRRLCRTRRRAARLSDARPALQQLRRERAGGRGRLPVLLEGG
uniref:(northern house mosquito) hypothetical protein n=1 Tax=Culex pipiens TaxID=7175 RepID=A0A8D8ADS9_CULPI